MEINEVFPHPTVKQVFFEVRFPNLLFMESKVGDLQLGLMTEFPESRIVYRQGITVVLNRASDAPMDRPVDAGESPAKEWHFLSPKGYTLQVRTDRFMLASDHHKAYNHPGSPDRFRDAIENVLASFLGTINVPIFTRVGLRYVDHCPMPARDTESFQTYYNSCLPLERFPLQDAQEMVFRAISQRGQYGLGYVESPQQLGTDKQFLLLDFDAFALNVEPSEALATADQLHDLLLTEYGLSIKQPVIEYMREGTTADEPIE